MCERTSDILEQNDCPYEIDFMLIDAESAEIEIINGIDFSKHRPKLMFIETMITGKEGIKAALPDFYVEKMSDGLNTLFIDKELKL